MRILFLVTQDLESPSGIGRYLPLAVELARLGHAVRVAATHSSYDQLSQRNVLINGVEVSYVAQMHVSKAGSHKQYFNLGQLIWNTFKSTLRLSAAALSKPVDMIYVAKPHPMNSLAGLLGRLRWGCRLALDVDDDETASGNFKSAWQKRLVGWFASHAPKWADWVSTNTHTMAEKLTRQGISVANIIYLPNGIEPDRFTPPDPRALQDLCSRIGLRDREVIVYVGSLGLVHHPINLLLDAFELLLAQRPGTALLFVGGGEDFENMQEAVKKRGLARSVVFSGRVSPAQANLYYRLGNVSVDPVFDNEVARCRCPLKMFESWACEVPFVTADVGDRRLLAGDPPAALLAAPGSPPDLARSLLDVLDNPALARRLAQSGRQRVKLYHWDELARKLNAELTQRA